MQEDTQSTNNTGQKLDMGNFYLMHAIYWVKRINTETV